MSNQQGYPGYSQSDHTYQEDDPYRNEGYFQHHGGSGYGQSGHHSTLYGHLQYPPGLGPNDPYYPHPNPYSPHHSASGYYPSQAEAERWARPADLPPIGTSHLQRSGMFTYSPNVPAKQEAGDSYPDSSRKAMINDESTLRRMLGMVSMQSPTTTDTLVEVSQSEGFQPSPAARSFTAPSAFSSENPSITIVESTQRTHEQPAGGDDKTIDEDFPTLQRAHTATSQYSTGGSSLSPGSGGKHNGRPQYRKLDWKS